MRKSSSTVAMITGASSGIGAALALDYARRGARIVLLARRLKKLEDLAGEIESRGGEALALVCDVAVDGDLEAAVAATLQRFGRIDHVVANAGFGVAGAVHKLDIEDFRRQFETNVFGVLRTVFATRDALVASRGVLAIVGSVNSYVSLPGVAPYCMSKHAVRALAGSLYYEYRRRGVAVVLVAPGFVESEIRNVDNRGVLHADARDPIPQWLSMRAPKAARKIVRAIYRRKRVAVITAHGKLAVFLDRHFPGFTAFMIRRLAIRGRREAG